MSTTPDALDTPDAPAPPAPVQLAEPLRRIRAAYTDRAVTVYQAYAPSLGLPAAREGRFAAAWKRERMVWIIKPRSQSSTTLPAAVSWTRSTRWESARLWGGTA